MTNVFYHIKIHHIDHNIIKPFAKAMSALLLENQVIARLASVDIDYWKQQDKIELSISRIL